jgi:hypothetical protein
MTQTLTVKDPAEQIVVTFDYTLALDVGETIQGTPTVSASATAGSDLSPSAILSGSPQVSGAKVLHTVIGGVDGSTYKLRCLATMTPSGRKLVLAGLLPCVTV